MEVSGKGEGANHAYFNCLISYLALYQISFRKYEQPRGTKFTLILEHEPVKRREPKLLLY